MIKKLIAIVAGLFVIAIGVVGYMFFKPPAAASGPLAAAPLNINANASDNTNPTMTINSGAILTGGDAAATNLTIFEIIPTASEARFLIDEVLKGDPVTVVGTTDQVAGQFAIDIADPTTAQVGPILVNARTLTTDNEFRNRALKNRILLTDNYEFVLFTPMNITGLPASVTPGMPYTFQMVGNLTITDMTRQVTFDVTVTPVSATRMEGTATTSFLYTDFELAIPDSPSVDTVEDTVRLEFDFAAESI